jgi:hypothetical protein
MRIFALETNSQKLIARVISPGSSVITHAGFHWIKFFVHLLRCLLTAVILLIIGWAVWNFTQVSLWWVLGGIALPLFLFVFWPLLNAYIDWRYDCIILTQDELILVDQTSIVKVSIRQMDLDNIASVAFHSQFWNLFGFGKLSFDLKEGTGKHLDLAFIPHAEVIASSISNAVLAHQKLRMQKPPVAPLAA